MPEIVSLDGLTAVAVAAGATDGREKPPVLFLHGMMAGAWIFERYQSLFAARGHASWALNLRGHCGSRPVPDLGRVSMRDYLEDALEAARALAAAHGVVRPVVVGHSMGGLTAQQLAERGAVEAAVLLGSAPPRGILVTGLALARRQLKYLWPILRSRPIVTTRDDLEALNFNRIPAADRAALFARFGPESGRAGSEMSFGSVAVDAARVRCPLLVCASSDDRFVPPRVARRIAEKYGARAEYREFPGHGHLALIEPGWEGPAEEIVRWIERTVGA